MGESNAQVAASNAPTTKLANSAVTWRGVRMAANAIGNNTKLSAKREDVAAASCACSAHTMLSIVHASSPTSAATKSG